MMDHGGSWWKMDGNGWWWLSGCAQLLLFFLKTCGSLMWNLLTSPINYHLDACEVQSLDITKHFIQKYRWTETMSNQNHYSHSSTWDHCWILSGKWLPFHLQALWIPCSSLKKSRIGSSGGFPSWTSWRQHRPCKTSAPLELPDCSSKR